MTRVFNTAGPCLAENHYIIPPLKRLSQLQDLIEGGYYFVIHAPRQTGKTTLLRNFSRTLTAEGKYAAITVSVESFVQDDIEKSIPSMVRDIERRAAEQLPEEFRTPDSAGAGLDPETGLKTLLGRWSSACPRPLVVFFDEIDALPGTVLISVLRQLRDGYTSRPAPFPHSVALVGLRDVQDYRIQVRQDSETLGTSSPFNIKKESLVLRNFTAAEVEELLMQHTGETNQEFSADAMKEIFHQTGGQPWLVNALASQLTTRYDALVKDGKTTVTVDHVMAAREILIERRDTHLDSLTARLQEGRVRRVIEPVLTGEHATDPTYDDDFSYVRDLGLVTSDQGVRQIANPIYREIIARALTHQVQTQVADQPTWYVAADGTLDMGKLIIGFREFWRENGEVLLKGMPYQEAAPHLVFMAYLQRIVNTGGQIHREFAAGTKRVDLVVDFGGRKDVIELKRAHGYKMLEHGLAQVSAYARRLSRDIGYLVIFDVKSEIPFEERGEIEEIEEKGVKVVILRV